MQRGKPTHVHDGDDLAHELLLVEHLNGSDSLLRGLHHHETEASRLPGVRVVHDRGLVDLCNAERKKGKSIRFWVSLKVGMLRYR